MEQSILTSVKHILGMEESYTVFDLDVLTHINSVFAILTGLGVGPEEGFTIEDATAEWSDFFPGDPVTPQQSLIKSYMHLRVKLLFDPPQTSFQIAPMERQIEMMEWRIHEEREVAIYEPQVQTPTSEDPFGDQLTVDGGVL